MLRVNDEAHLAELVRNDRTHLPLSREDLAPSPARPAHSLVDAGPTPVPVALPVSPIGVHVRADRAAWYHHRRVAERLSSGDGEQLLVAARDQLPALRAAAATERQRRWAQRWTDALDGPVIDLVTLMLRTDQVGVELRQISPFT